MYSLARKRLFIMDYYITIRNANTDCIVYRDSIIADSIEEAFVCFYQEADFPIDKCLNVSTIVESSEGEISYFGTDATDKEIRKRVKAVLNVDALIEDGLNMNDISKVKESSV